MKKTMIYVLALLLIVCAFSGCGRRDNGAAQPTPGVNNNNTVSPDDNNGVVNDGNGIIGNDNATDTNVPEGIIPEIGNGIEQGVDDVINGVDNAFEGNDNNAGSNTANAGTNGRARNAAGGAKAR